MSFHSVYLAIDDCGINWDSQEFENENINPLGISGSFPGPDVFYKVLKLKENKGAIKSKWLNPCYFAALVNKEMIRSFINETYDESMYTKYESILKCVDDLDVNKVYVLVGVEI